MNDIFDMVSTDYESVIDRTGFNPDRLDIDAVDQHFAVLDREDRVRARCSVWWRESAQVNGTRTGTIGHYAATGEAFGAAVLEHACSVLRQRACEIAVGPMDGNTWRRYRFITERGTARPFFLEPDNPDDYPVHFRRCGFDSLAAYVSEINHSIETRQPALGALRDKMRQGGIEISPIDCTSPGDDLDGIYRVICESFSHALMYTTLDRESFRQMYEPLIREVDPRLMLVARQGGEVVGFVFSPPDLAQRAYHDTVDTIVIKTVAVRPDSAYSGLGRVLIVDMLQNAIDMGFRSAISALMHVENRSQKISSDCAGPMRRYELFARDLRQ